MEEVRRRLIDLDPDQELAGAAGAAVRWRAVDPFATFFLPLPLVIQRVPEIEGDWRDEPSDVTGCHELVGLDAASRPVAHLLDAGGKFERAKQVWRWDDDGSFLEVELMGSGPHVRRARVAGGQIVHVAGASPGDECSIHVLGWSGDLATRADGATTSRWHHGRAEARVAVTAGDGTLERLVEAREPFDLTGERPPPAQTPEARHRELAEALARAAALEPAETLWDGRTEAPEPWPGLKAARALAEPLAVALDAALRAAAAAAAIIDPFVLEVQSGGGVDRPALPPFARLGGVAFRDGMRAASREHEAALHNLHRGVEAGQVAELALVEHLDPEALRACRVLSTALRTGAPPDVSRKAAHVADAVGDRLAALLNAVPLDGAARPFMAMVLVGDRYADGGPDPALRRARRAVGRDAVLAFQESLRSTAPTPSARLAERALTDRDALEELLREGGIAGDAHRLAHEVAEFGVRLASAPAGAPLRSRLGGPPVLPPGVPWPTADGGAPLSFLAALDLAELAADGGAPALPTAGWLLFFAALQDDIEGAGLYESEPNAAGAMARVLRLPPEVEPVTAVTPPELEADEWLVLHATPVVGRRELTLPDGYDAGQQLDLDVFAAAAYEELGEVLAVARGSRAESEEGPGPRLGDHWVGGLVAGPQGHPSEPGTILLLHLGDDDDLGFLLDAGAIQFRIPAAALAAEDWSEVTAYPDS